MPERANQNQPLIQTINHAAIDRSLLCLAIGQINVSITWRLPDRPPIRKIDWSHWAFAFMVVAFAVWNIWWLIQASIRHFYTAHWGDAVLVFGAQVLASLTVLEWCLLKPRRKARQAPTDQV